MYSKGNDHFVILSQQKAQKVRNESGVVYVVHFKSELPEATTTHTFSGEKPSSWAQNQVGLAIDAGIVPQSLQSRYTNTATRADFCALVVTLLEKYLEITLPAEETFSDTDDINVRKAATLGIVQGAVSYTHLDVYKRQGIQMPIPLVIPYVPMSRPCAESCGRVWMTIPSRPKDVYKRQLLLQIVGGLGTDAADLA